MLGILNIILLVIGVLECLLACSIIACGVLSTAIKTRLYPVAHGIWCGAFFLVPALAATVASTSKKRGYHAGHVLTAVVSCIFVIPCLIGLFIIEWISDSWYSFWLDQDTCQGGCFKDDGTYTRINYALMWTTVYTAQERIICSSSTWRSTCHPNTYAVILEIVAISLATGLWILFLISTILSCIWTRSIWRKSDIIKRIGASEHTQEGINMQKAQLSSPMLYTAWNLPQYNTVQKVPGKTPIIRKNGKKIESDTKQEDNHM